MIRNIWKIFPIIIAIASVGCWRDGVLVVDEAIKVIASSLSDILRSSTERGSIASQLLKPTVDVAKGVKRGLGWGMQATTPHGSFWHWGSKEGRF